MNPARRVWLLALPVIVLAGLVAWWFWPDRDPVFHGKRESEWIGEIWPMPPGYSLAELQYEQWIEFGPEGLPVLARGLDREWRKANSPWKRLYLKAHHHLGPHVPFMPSPDDPAGSKRRRLIQLLSDPSIPRGKGMAWVDKSVARALRDRDVQVRIAAIRYFTGLDDKKRPLNELDDKLKRKLLPEFIRAIERKHHPSEAFGGYPTLRASASLALGYYPEAAEIVTPLLEDALLDPSPDVRVVAAGSLQRVNPDRARELDAVGVVLGHLGQPNEGYRGLAVRTLREFETEVDVIIPALLDGLETRDHIIGNIIIRTIEHFGKDRPDLLIPALQKAAQREDEAGRKAAAALERLEADVGSTLMDQL